MMAGLKAVENRVRMMLARAIVSLVDDAAQAQALQVELLEGESQDGVERFQQYGLSAHPHPGAEALVAFVGGLRSHGVVLAVEDRRYRLKGLQQGEVALYDDLGNVVLLGREALTVTAVAKLRVEAPAVEIACETATVDASDTVSMTAPGGVTIAANVAIVGDVAIDGELTVAGDTSVTGVTLLHGNLGVMGDTSLTGGLSATGAIAGADVSAGSVSLANHKHSGVTAGTAQTGVPA